MGWEANRVESDQFNGWMKFTHRIDSHLSDVAHARKSHQCRCTFGEFRGASSPFNQHGHERPILATRSIMFEIREVHMHPIWVMFSNGRHSSSVAWAFMSSRLGRVASWLGHAASSTPFIFRRSAARWSSGDHFSGAAAWAVSPQCGQVVFRENFPQVKHCCIR